MHAFLHAFFDTSWKFVYMGNRAALKGRVNKTKVLKAASSVIPGGPKKGFTAAIKASKSRSITKRDNSQSPLKLSSTCPITIAIVPFHESIFNEKMIEFIDALVPETDDQYSIGNEATSFQVRTGYVKGTKTFVKLITPNLRTTVTGILDIAKVADVLLCVFPSSATYENSAFDELGYSTLTALRMQGLPPLVLGTVVDIADSKLGMKTVQRYFYSEFSEDKAKFVMPSANSRDVMALGKQIMQTVVSQFSGNLSANVSEQLALRRQRGYMLIDTVTEEEDGLVAITGYSRGAGFSLENPVCLTGVSFPFIVRRVELLAEDNGMGESVELSSEQRQLLMESITPLRPAEMQEQTWPTEEEELEAEQNFMEQKMKRVVVPRGVAADSMEAAWLVEEADAEEAEDEKIIAEMCNWGKEVENDPTIFTAKKPELEQRTREEMDFVDEVDTPQTVPARERFQRYRGLKSLRNANWDPYEELPVEYSQIHEFQDMQFTAKEGFTSIAESGKFNINKRCRIVLEPTDSVSSIVIRPLVASTISVNECKVTVVHARVQRLPESVDEEIKSKQLVTIQCGLRRFSVRPIYSDIPKYSSSTGTSPIQRMHRQLPNDTQASILMSFYAPAIFGSSPVVVFDGDTGDKKLLWGSVAGCAPNKPVVVKRITLTGYPFRVHQTRAVVRFMFFNPQDIDWFKPVELTTKKGLRGHIAESLGTHGYMKCRFNGQLTSDDIVCMHLYKRVYPKWFPGAWTSESVNSN